jgi:uncharacterized delta-60 repeat protein
MTLAATLLLSPTARAAEGFPDATFGSGGFTIVDEPELPGESLEDLVILPDGKILTAGTRGGADGFLLARFNTDGSLDQSFGPGGIRTFPDTNAEDSLRSISAIARRDDGRILAAGLGRGMSGNDAFAIARYLPDFGEPDTEFAGTGSTTLAPGAPGTPGEARDVDLAPDGKVVAAGYNNSTSESAVLRLTENGVPDPTFGVNPPIGFRVFHVPGSTSDQAQSTAVLEDGSVLVGGRSSKGAYLAKLNSAGEPVAGFGSAGFAVEDLGEAPTPSGTLFDIEPLRSGRILAVGYANVDGGGDKMLVATRFTAGGDLDPSFASGGILRLNPTAGIDGAAALSVQPDGRIVLAGYRGASPGSASVWLLRLSADGALDPTFGNGGETVAAPSPGENVGLGLDLQSNGLPVVVGSTGTTGDIRLLVGRFASEPESIKVSAIASRERCGGRTASIVGTAGPDKLKGTRKADVIAGLGGADRIRGLAGNDVICGGPGRDTINGGPGRDTLLGEAGRDRLLGGPGKKDLCNGGPGRDVKKADGCERRRKLP